MINRVRSGGRRLVMLTLIALASGLAAAQERHPAETPKAFSIVRDTGVLSVDGRMDEAIWSRAARIDDFYQVEPFEFAEPSQRTEVWLYYDDEALYIGARLWDTEAERITANVLRQGEGLGSEDSIAIILDPYLDRRSGYRFMMNANGVRWDALYQNIRELESNWEGIWQGASSRDADGWTVEMAIPFKTLSFNPNTSEWGINFERFIPRVSETIGWVSRNRQLNPSVAGTVSGFQGLQQGRGLDIVPSSSVREAKTYGVSGTTDSNFEPSVDIFYKVTPSLNASLTVNTDFSATEVDDRQVNLSRFSLFFPEKRDFFLQDTDIFEFGRIGGAGGGFGGGGGGGGFRERNFAVPNASEQNARPFFSRRIGLSSSGQPVDIEYGGKLSGRIGRWSLGSLLIRQDDFGSVEGDDIFVGRIAANVLEESAIGLIYTDGDPSSNDASSTVGADFRYTNSRLSGGRLLEAQAWYQQTDDDTLDSDNKAYGFGIEMPNAVGWRFDYEQKVVEENFDPAVGFIDRTGIRDHALAFGYQKRFRGGGWIRSNSTGLDAYRQERLGTGELDTQVLAVRLFSISTNTNDRIFGQYNFNTEVLLEPFVVAGLVIPAGEYKYEDLRMGGRSGNQRRISVGGSLQIGDYYTGKQSQYNVQFEWRPSEKFRLGTNYRINEISLPGGERTVRVSSLQAQYIFSSTLSWVNLIQYDNISENIGLNSRLHWIPQAGREGFIVFNHSMVDYDRNDSFHSTSADMSLKFSYTFRF